MMLQEILSLHVKKIKIIAQLKMYFKIFKPSQYGERVLEAMLISKSLKFPLPNAQNNLHKPTSKILALFKKI